MTGRDDKLPVIHGGKYFLDGKTRKRDGGSNVGRKMIEIHLMPECMHLRTEKTQGKIEYAAAGFLYDEILGVVVAA